MAIRAPDGANNIILSVRLLYCALSFILICRNTEDKDRLRRSCLWGEGDGVNNLASQAPVNGAIFSAQLD